jgi:hypothetical protein
MLHRKLLIHFYHVGCIEYIRPGSPNNPVVILRLTWWGKSICGFLRVIKFSLPTKLNCHDIVKYCWKCHWTLIILILTLRSWKYWYEFRIRANPCPDLIGTYKHSLTLLCSAHDYALFHFSCETGLFFSGTGSGKIYFIVYLYLKCRWRSNYQKGVGTPLTGLTPVIWLLAKKVRRQPNYWTNEVV